ncbi:MAG: prepilin-type N-terminal cleavage/methylation domain-containing protein [Candidatus Gracilibacteria bacterium]|nr:prepilin-type N-terminal cleavage/methylation domain-containing protein [Candidatus Gracilibacteria bacterium]
MQKNNKAFTLVELIVVITILAILGTIAFINLQGYSVSARDGKRISDINNIMKKIGIETSKGTSISSLINTTKTNSGLIIDGNSGSSIQGTANFATLKEDGSKFKDPVTKGDYVFSYSVGGSGTGAYKFNQVSTVNEETNTAVVKGNYYKMQTGDTPSIIINVDDFFVEDGGVDLPYEIVAAGTTPLIVTNRYPGCDTDDITVGSYTISACNVGATTASIDWTVSGGEYFQWGRNKGFTYLDNSQQPTTLTGSIGLNASTDDKGFVWNESLVAPYSWANTDITNNWGDTTDTPLGTNILARQGPCASGYHVPSNTEWQGIVTTGGWGSNGANMQIALKLPYAGYRNWDGGYFYNGGSFGGYWSSSPNGVNAYHFGFVSSSIGTNNSDYQAYGFSVRCFKN